MPDNDEVRYIAAALRRLDHIVSVIEQHHRQFVPIDDVLRDFGPELLQRIDKIERSIALILAKQETGAVDAGLNRLTGELRSEMVSNHISSLKRQLVRQYQNLNQLKEEAAVYGTAPPLHIRNKLHDIRSEIERLETELDYFHTI